jgi:NADPH:quinone reductase-like Zn-dependent oxidoreductase
MKAAYYHSYGPPEVLTVKEIVTPVPKDNELLIKVRAATVSRTDCHNLTGAPWVMRFVTGFFKPRLPVTGTDFAGEITAIGKNVKSYTIGERIAGFEFVGLQSHANYLILKDTAEFVRIPETFPYDQAVACVEGAYYALNVIHRLNPKPGQKAIVNGATGAIGSAMMQFFKFYGVQLTAVCRPEHRELVKSLGAEKIVDYTIEDFTQDQDRYDFVFDAVGKSSFAKCKSLLKKKGIYATSGAPNLFHVFITPIFGEKKEVFCPPKNLKECLNFTIELVVKGKFTPVIDRHYPLNEIREAFKYVLTGQKLGNVVIVTDI